MNLRLTTAAAAAVLAVAGPALAHHSFAVFFDETRTETVEGTVTSFRFTNPHATIAMDVKGPGGEVQKWRIETTAPVVLQRRGWSRESVHAGDKIRVSGWPARASEHYMRLQAATTLDGKPIGQGFGANDD